MHQRRTSRRLAGLAVLVLLVVAAAAIIGTGVGRSARTATTLVDGTTDTVTNLDPAGEYDYGSFTLDVLIFQGLYGFPTSEKLQPVLATGCKSSANLKTWTCTLRKGVKFSDGSFFDSSDVKWSFDRVIKIHDPSGIDSLLSNLKSVSTKGSGTVVFHLKSSQSTWPFILATNAGYIVPKDTYPATKLQANNKPQIGTGPYKLVKYSPGQQAVFKVNDHYAGPKPKNDTLIVRYYSKSSTMKLALQRGEIDIAFRDFTPTEITSLRAASSIKVHSGNGVVIRYLVFNVKRPPFNKLALRKAVAYLMPRQALATRIYHGQVKPLYSMVPAGLPGHIDVFASTYGRAPSVAKARAVLKGAGVKTPVKIELWSTPSHYGDASADEFAEMKRALDASGLFKVTLKTAEWAQYSDAVGRVYNAFQLGWFPDYPDAEDYIVPFYQVGNFTENGYSNPKMNSLINQEHAAKTPAKRFAAIRAAQRLSARDVPIIPYWQGKMIVVGRSNVKGIDQTLDASFNLRFWLLSKS
jgi:peptide/nickel transport system substrate-binding protein